MYIYILQACVVPLCIKHGNLNTTDKCPGTHALHSLDVTESDRRGGGQVQDCIRGGQVLGWEDGVS